MIQRCFTIDWYSPIAAVVTLNDCTEISKLAESGADIGTDIGTYIDTYINTDINTDIDTDINTDTGIEALEQIFGTEYWARRSLAVNCKSIAVHMKVKVKD